jgi:hypothetical protein
VSNLFKKRSTKPPDTRPDLSTGQACHMLESPLMRAEQSTVEYLFSTWGVEPAINPPLLRTDAYTQGSHLLPVSPAASASVHCHIKPPLHRRHIRWQASQQAGYRQPSPSASVPSRVALPISGSSDASKTHADPCQAIALTEVSRLLLHLHGPSSSWLALPVQREWKHPTRNINFECQTRFDPSLRKASCSAPSLNDV